MSEKPQDGSQQKSRNNNSNNRQGGNNGGSRNNRGNNRNRNDGNRNKGGNNRNQNQNRNRNQEGKNKKPAPKPLTFWQKILGFFGSKPEATPSSSKKPQQKKNTDKPAAKKARPPQKVEVTSGRLYVGNLSYETTEYDLEDLFKGNGPVKSVEIIYNRHTHKSKGYGFIEMMKVEDAKNAVDVHHDQPFMGRMLIVNGAKNKQTEGEREEPAA